MYLNFCITNTGFISRDAEWNKFGIDFLSENEQWTKGNFSNEGLT